METPILTRKWKMWDEMVERRQSCRMAGNTVVMLTNAGLDPPEGSCISPGSAPAPHHRAEKAWQCGRYINFIRDPK